MKFLDLERRKTGWISPDEALKKLQRYCAYQERCHQEVRNKLIQYGVYGDDLEWVMAALIADNFLNEERFAKSFARGKFRLKFWGRQKITGELKKRDIPAYCIRKGLEEIDEAEYEEVLRSLLLRKWRDLKGSESDFEKGRVAGMAAIRRGFEPSLVWELVRQVSDPGQY